MIFWSRVRWFAIDFHEWRITVNNDFLVTSEVICQWFLANHWFSLVTSSLAKIIGKSPASWPKIECIILFLTRYFMFWTHHFATNNHRSLISPLSMRTVFSDLTLWRHHSWSVTSSERATLALLCPVRRLFLQAQIGAKAIFTRE